MVTNQVPRYWTVEEYLAYEEETGIKHEYIDGEIYAISGGTNKHSRIAANCIIAVGKRLKNPCHINTSDMRVKISDIKFVYPDFSVVCGEATFDDENETKLINPTFVAEVISPSSESYDRGMKSEFYRSLPSLQAYLLLDQKRVHAQLYTRHEAGWLLREFIELDAVIPLETLEGI
jgi:Uma2 family endonuclease